MRQAALGLLALAVLAAAYPAWLAHRARAVENAVREGDLVFQICPSKAGLAIRLATGSLYDHVGVVVEERGGPMVCEAVDEVRLTPLAAWVRRGIGGLVAIRRLRDARLLSGAAASRLRACLHGFLGRPYDFHFSEDDANLYCSELAWKAYRRGLSVELCPLRRLGDYRLGSGWTKRALDRLSGAPLSPDTRVVAPADLLRSPFLQPVPYS